MHKFRRVAQTPSGFVERCERCGKQMHFPIAPGANTYYLSYHIRDVLRANDPMFRREYPHVKQ